MWEFFRHGWPQQVDDLRLKPFFNRRFELPVEQDCLLWGLRVIIPTRYQEDLLEELHTGHPGIVRMKELAHSYLWWPNVDLQIEQTVRNCGSCQEVRKPPAVAPLAPWMWPSNPWHRVQVDYAENRDENEHYLIIVDVMRIPAGQRFSLWQETRQLRQRSPSYENCLVTTQAAQIGSMCTKEIPLTV